MLPIVWSMGNKRHQFFAYNHNNEIWKEQDPKEGKTYESNDSWRPTSLLPKVTFDSALEKDQSIARCQSVSVEYLKQFGTRTQMDGKTHGLDDVPDHGPHAKLANNLIQRSATNEELFQSVRASIESCSDNHVSITKSHVLKYQRSTPKEVKMSVIGRGGIQ